ncbi:uncharacterized protein PFL1_02558 [Pseudozyma flocculosa PF-1]|uniref:Zn(2)-C6 fungal-type domain-containing protein n=2 Tax=Pseudozyma flocculosa TaxID=84751 RepID=A0A5C3F0H7_9BASI|nr:uncharacterized protein PFL1_02558 [Pseudozyma flocculosa PF-1]EPQ29885.1 hypothetical protein PFL1_02558 [Pseudozyma flocculosa PF-1]SPO37187.1 uncharacterized protein PSFLO_02659 [Pseudozyma flocculosa]
MSTSNAPNAPIYGHPQGAASLSGHDLSLYTSSQASSSSSSLIDPSSDRSSLSGGHGNAFSPRPGSGMRSDRSGPGPSSSSQGFGCPNCGKTFARDDLLRRHLAREARALAQPSFDRQKSCYECARSKARCDLEVPACGRCRSRGKQCAYAPRSGNPNVRKARHGVMVPTTLPGGSMQDASGTMAGMSPMPQGQFGADGNGGQPWAMQSPAFGPGYVKREGEAEYDSTSDSEFGRSWNESYGDQLRLARSMSNSSSSVGSSVGSPQRPYGLSDVPDSAPPAIGHFGFSSNMAQGFQPPARTESPHSYGEVPLGPSASVHAMHGGSASRSSGFSRTNTGSIVTNMDKQGARYAQDEGEETPIVRVTNSFAQATGLEPRDPHDPSTSHHLTTPGGRQKATSLPHPGDGHTLGDSDMSDGWNPRMTHVPSQAVRLGPPTHPGQSLMPPPPQPPSLITSNLARTGSQMMFPSPVRPSLFTNGLDLSGWLEEPVVPSPLYRMGPGFHSTQFMPFTGMSGGMLQSPIVEAPISARFAASLAQLVGASSATADGIGNVQAGTAGNGESAPGTNPAQPSLQTNVGVGPNRSLSDPSGAAAASRFDQDGTLPQQGAELPTAKQCWTAPEQSGEVKASLAQLSAACFVSVPSFLALNDPAAPCPPNIHRRWLLEFRNTQLSLLANARCVLAGYFVRLPASEGFVWKLIADQIKAIIVGSVGLCGSDTSEVEVLSAVSALWMYLVLLIFTDDAACTQHVDSELLDSGLCALSELSQNLSARLRSGASAGAASEGSGAGDASTASEADFAAFSQSETTIRNLFAVYSLLVLQRFRENGHLLKDKLVGCDLVLDIPLPAGAAEFEASDEEQWRAERTKAAEALRKAECPSTRPTLRHLLAARKSMASQDVQQQQQSEQEPAWVKAYFDGQDAFTNIVLSVALALDVDREAVSV